jgi:hypothetical protein
MIKDEQWPVARLIPISSAKTGIEAEERRAASALLAVLGAVDEFGRALLKPLGAPAGKIETFIEIPFKVNGRPVRPDGIIAVSHGGKSWGAIVEVKTRIEARVARTQASPRENDRHAAAPRTAAAHRRARKGSPSSPGAGGLSCHARMA